MSGANPGPFPCRARFPAFNEESGYPMQLDEWVFEAGTCNQFNNIISNQISSRITYCARLPAHANLAKVHAMSVLQDVSPSGKLQNLPYIVFASVAISELVVL